jgi:hypothetical protein
LAELQNGSDPALPLGFVCVQPEATEASVELQWVAAGDTAFPPPVIERLLLPYQGSPLAFQSQTVVGWVGDDPVDPAFVNMGLIGVPEGQVAPILVGVRIPQEDYRDGTHVFHGFETLGAVASLIPPELSRGPLQGVFGAGTLTLENASREPGAVVKVTWDGYHVPWAVPVD